MKATIGFGQSDDRHWHTLWNLFQSKWETPQCSHMYEETDCWDAIFAQKQEDTQEDLMCYAPGIGQCYVPSKWIQFNSAAKLQPAAFAIGSDWSESKTSVPMRFFFSIISTCMSNKRHNGSWIFEVQLTLVCDTGPPLLKICLSFAWDELLTALPVFFSFLCCTDAGCPADTLLWAPVLFEADFPLNLASPWPFLKNVLWGFWLAFWVYVSALETLIR